MASLYFNATANTLYYFALGQHGANAACDLAGVAPMGQTDRDYQEEIRLYLYCPPLTHLPQDKMAAILAGDNSECISLNENIWMANTTSLKYVSWVQLTIYQYWFR